MDHKRHPMDALYLLIAITEMLFCSLETPLVAMVRSQVYHVYRYNRQLYRISLQIFTIIKLSKNI
jgi:hypothetical protein